MRYDPHNQYDDDVPWWAKVLGVAVLCGLVWGLLWVVKWFEHH
ncbi:hypothetical protein [Hymenobacter properus]|nr:hypothetical protein [Hymenobacter properus]